MKPITDSQAIQMGLGAVALWSTVATAFSVSLDYLTPLQLVLIASCVSWCFFCVRLVKPRRRDALLKSSTPERIKCLTLGLINPGVYYLILFSAYDQLPTQEAMAINYSWGITMALLAVPLLKQTISGFGLSATGVSYLGVLIIATRGAPASLQFAQPTGATLAILSTLIWSFYWLLNSKLTLDAEVALFLNFSGALPLLFGITLLVGDDFNMTWQGLLGGIYVGLFEMGIAFVLWITAMKATSSTLKISSLIFLSPPLSLIFIWLVLGEPIQPYTLVGLGLILFGIWMQHRLGP